MNIPPGFYLIGPIYPARIGPFLPTYVGPFFPTLTVLADLFLKHFSYSGKQEDRTYLHFIVLSYNAKEEVEKELLGFFDVNVMPEFTRNASKKRGLHTVHIDKFWRKYKNKNP